MLKTFKQFFLKKGYEYACCRFEFSNLYDLKLLVTTVPSSAAEITST